MKQPDQGVPRQLRRALEHTEKALDALNDVKQALTTNNVALAAHLLPHAYRALNVVDEDINALDHQARWERERGGHSDD